MSTVSSAEVKTCLGVVPTRDRIKRWETKAMRRVFRFKKRANYCTRAARVARKVRTMMKLPFLSEVIAESKWRAMGWVCDEGPNAVVNTLKQVFRWRSTQWWQDPYNHSRWKHMWGWNNRGCLWDKVTEWAGDEDWICERERCQTMEDANRFVTFALRSVKHSTVHRIRIGKERKKQLKTKYQEYWCTRTKPHIFVKKDRQRSYVETERRTIAFSLGSWNRGNQGP